MQMRAAERLYSILTTGIHDARNRVKSLFYEEIGYSLTQWNIAADNVTLSLYQPEVLCVNDNFKIRINNLEDIPLTNASHVADHVQKNEAMLAQLIKRCQDLELFVMQEVIICYGEKDENILMNG